MRNPHVLLLDEPTSALDVLVRAEVRSVLGRVLRDRFAVVVTHDLRDLLAWRPTLVLLAGGQVSEVGQVDEPPTHPFLVELLRPVAP